MVLVLWDTDQIKNYVFATHRLREIRGASAILDELNEQEIAKIVEGVAGPNRMVYAGGGSAMATLDSKEQAEEVIRAVEMKYNCQTQAATITGTWIEMDDLSEPGKSGVEFGEYARRLNHKLRAIKDQKVRERIWRTSPVLKACRSCGLYPAEHFFENMDDAFVCDACRIKQEASRKVREGEFKSRLGELLTYARGRGKWQTLRLEDAPEHFNKIGDTATPEGYIGFIYADGNRMGALLRHLKGKEDFSTFSNRVRDTLREITFDALLHFFPNPRKPLPFEIIFIGGDDLMIVTAANKALEIAAYLCREFERRTAPILAAVGFPAHRQHLSLCAAVVLSHATLPIYHLQSVAADLLKSAKRHSLKILEDGKGDTGCIDFHVVTASASETPSTLRKTIWQPDKGQPSERTLTERPYTAEGLQGLIDRVRELKATNFPRSKLQMLYEALVGQSKEQAMFTWAFMAGRVRENQAAALFNIFPETDGLPIWPWRERETAGVSTPMLDVVELYDFI